MRSKRKILLIFNAVFLSLYILSIAFFFSKEYQMSKLNYDAYKTDISDFIQLCETDQLTSSDAIILSAYERLILNNIPTIVAICDKNGDIVKESGLHKTSDFDFIDFIDIDTSRFKHNLKLCNKIEELILLNKKEIQTAYKEESWISGGFNDFTFDSTYLELDDGNYMLVVSSRTDFYYDTLNSEDFLSLSSAFSAICFAIYIILLIILLKIIQANERNNKVKTAFTSAAAHELKTPLSVIENQCECIMENVAPEKNTEYINSIYAEALRMNKLVASLLQYNRLASADKIKMEKCRLDEIVNTEIEKYQTYFNTKDICLETEIYENAEIKCNAELIALVIDNYLSNAVKHTKNGNTIKIKLKKYNNSYRFSVYNEGKNIPSEYNDMLFNVLYKTDKARNCEDHSTGMGLAICKEILNQHKYKYGYYNKRDGVEFYFTT